MSTNEVIQNMLEMTQKSYEILRKSGDLTQNKRIRLDERIKTLQEVLEKIQSLEFEGFLVGELMNKEKEIEEFRLNVLPFYEQYVEEQQKYERIRKKSTTVKQCRICGKYKMLSDFYKNPLKKLGRFDECKKCIKERRQQNVDRKRKAGVKASMSA